MATAAGMVCRVLVKHPLVGQYWSAVIVLLFAVPIGRPCRVRKVTPELVVGGSTSVKSEWSRAFLCKHHCLSIGTHCARWNVCIDMILRRKNNVKKVFSECSICMGVKDVCYRNTYKKFVLTSFCIYYCNIISICFIPVLVLWCAGLWKNDDDDLVVSQMSE